MPETAVSTIEHDIANLERLLQEKKSVLENEKSSSGSIPESHQSEKEILHEIVGEKIQEHVPDYLPAGKQASLIPSPVIIEPPSYLSQELKDKIQEIIALVFAKNLEEGIKEVAKSGNMALIDAFHDILVDELYSKLVERKKLDKVE